MTLVCFYEPIRIGLPGKEPRRLPTGSVFLTAPLCPLRLKRDAVEHCEFYIQMTLIKCMDVWIYFSRADLVHPSTNALDF
jgi:hypothetical protein